MINQPIDIDTYSDPFVFCNICNVLIRQNHQTNQYDKQIQLLIPDRVNVLSIPDIQRIKFLRMAIWDKGIYATTYVYSIYINKDIIPDLNKNDITDNLILWLKDLDNDRNEFYVIGYEYNNFITVKTNVGYGDPRVCNLIYTNLEVNEIERLENFVNNL